MCLCMRECVCAMKNKFNVIRVKPSDLVFLYGVCIVWYVCIGILTLPPRSIIRYSALSNLQCTPSLDDVPVSF